LGAFVYIGAGRPTPQKRVIQQVQINNRRHFHFGGDRSQMFVWAFGEVDFRPLRVRFSGFGTRDRGRCTSAWKLFV